MTVITVTPRNPKPRIFEAIQWDGTVSGMGAIIDAFNPHSAYTNVLKSGDWLIRTSRYGFIHLTDAKFQTRFAPAAGKPDPPYEDGQGDWADYRIEMRSP